MPVADFLYGGRDAREKAELSFLAAPDSICSPAPSEVPGRFAALSRSVKKRPRVARLTPSHPEARIVIVRTKPSSHITYSSSHVEAMEDS